MSITIRVDCIGTSVEGARLSRFARSCLVSLTGVAFCAIGCAETASHLVRQGPRSTSVARQEPVRSESAEQAAELERRLLTNPDDIDVGDRLARLYHRQRRYAAARRRFEGTLALAPSRSATRVRYASLLADLGDTRRALREVERALDGDKGLGDAHALKGRLLRTLGGNAEALEAFRAGWACDPPSIAAGFELARWDVGRQRYDSATDRLRLCLIHAPTDNAIRKTYARVLADQGDVDEAIVEWERLIRAGEPGAEPHLHLAVLYHESGNWASAFSHFEQARRIAPDHAAADSIERLLAGRLPTPTGARDFPSLLPAEP